jgi:hypothetical protein
MGRSPSRLRVNGPAPLLVNLRLRQDASIAKQHLKAGGVKPPLQGEFEEARREG